MKHKIVYNISGYGSKLPKYYILTPEQIDQRQKYRLGPHKTLRANFIEDHSVKKQLFQEDDYTNIHVLDTPVRKSILRTGNHEEFKHLGKGGFGSVFLAIVDDRLIACKKVKLEARVHRKSFCKEYNGLHLNHPNIIPTLAIHQGPKYGLVLMEKGGVSLQVILMQGHLSDKHKVDFALQICAGLKYLHSNGVLHLDVKPMNMLVDEKTEILRLCDFGNSEMKNSFGRHRCMGTVRYTAPEIFCGFFPTENCDVYSVGITMWQLLLNKVPYEDFRKDDQLIYQISKKQIRPTPEGHPLSQRMKGMKIYQDTYKMCWFGVADVRPTLDDIMSNLSASKSCLGSNGKWREDTFP